MLPKSSKHCIAPTAEELGQDSQLIQDAVGFYYSLLRKTLVELSHTNIQIENLGTFSVKRKEVPLLIKKYNKHLGILTKDTFNQMTLRKETEKKLANAIKLQGMIDTEKTRKHEFITKKNERNLKNNQV